MSFFHESSQFKEKFYKTEYRVCENLSLDGNIVSKQVMFKVQCNDTTNYCDRKLLGHFSTLLH